MKLLDTLFPTIALAEQRDELLRRLDGVAARRIEAEQYGERLRQVVLQQKERIDRLVRLFAWEIRAHDETKRVLVERQDQAGRVQYLERELKDMESSRQNLTDIADGLRNELLALKAKRRKR